MKISKYLCAVSFLTLLLSACAPLATPPRAPSPSPAMSVTPTTKSTATHNPPADPTPPPLALVDPRDLQGQTVRFIHPWAGRLADEVTAIIMEFNRTNLFDIQVEIVQAGSANALIDAVAVSLDANTRPHLAVASLDEILAWDALSPVSVDLQPYIDDPEWGLNSKEKADLLPARLDSLRHQDDLLGLPAVVDLQVLFYNQTWARELGFINPPIIPEDFELQACRAARANQLRSEDEREYTGTGGWLVNTDAAVSMSWLATFNASPALADGSLLFDTPKAANTFTFLRDLYDQDCAWLALNPLPYEYFANRQALFYSGSLRDTLEQDYTNTRLASQDDWSVIPYPGEDRNPVVFSETQAYTILSAEPDQQMAAWLVLRWLLQPAHHVSMIKYSGSLPVHASSIEYLGEFEVLYPQWSDVAAWNISLMHPPANPDWLTARRLLEDFAWQIYQSNVSTAQIPDFLVELDDQIELLTRTK